MVDRFVFGLWFMTAAEARQPLEEDPELREAFEVVELGVDPAPRNPGDLFLDLRSDRAEYARSYAGYIRAFSASSLKAGIFLPSAGDEAGALALSREFYRRIEQLYVATPDAFVCEIWDLTVLLRRR